MKVTIDLLPKSSNYKQGGSVMSTSQMIGIRMFCLALGWAFGALLFGTETTWLFGVQSFIWCGFAGGTIGILLTTK
jgi:hypothetical protein